MTNHHHRLCRRRGRRPEHDIVDQGKVVEVCDTSRRIHYDASTEPASLPDLGGSNHGHVCQNRKRIAFGGVLQGPEVYYSTPWKPRQKYGTPVPGPSAWWMSGPESKWISPSLLRRVQYRSATQAVLRQCLRQRASDYVGRPGRQLKSEVLTALKPPLPDLVMGIRYSDSRRPHHGAFRRHERGPLHKWRDLRGIVMFLRVTRQGDEADEAPIRKCRERGRLGSYRAGRSG